MKKFVLPLFLILFLGLAVFQYSSAKDQKDKDDKGPLSKITFIHYKKGHAKPSGAVRPPKETTCYSFLASGAKWKTTEDYFVNPTGSNNSDQAVLDAFSKGTAEWETYSDGFDIFGTQILDNTTNSTKSLYDGNNMAFFAPYSDPDVIAVATIWGYFGGSPKTRELVEWDIQFNTKFDWGENSDPSIPVMDIQNIATHELGHAAGLGDLYNTSCNLETMYGYSWEGDIIKRDLNLGDIKGIQALY